MLRYKKVLNTFDTYLASKNTWFGKNHPDKKHHTIAYFSAEYGLNEVLPIYSGGLGVLSGDHCKSASDLGLPFVPIGLFYKQGYFSQHINAEGWQETMFADLIISHIPIKPAYNANNEEIIITLEYPGRLIHAKIWEVKIGRISLYLMDTDIDVNAPYDRLLTSRLYGGDQETRIQQEILLGIGGIKVLEALGIKPTVYHMNEGHSSFLGLELIKALVQEKGLSFREAKEAVSSSVVFTTHTPVPAGNDVFPIPMIDKYFSNYWPFLGINRHEFLDLGLKIGEQQNFNMTVLALNIAGRKNGVSELHGAVSRNIFKNVWPGLTEDEIPIGHITNGVHTLTWLSPSIKDLYNKYLGEGWPDKLDEQEVLNKIDTIPDEELWTVHNALKEKMILFVREKLKQQKQLNGESVEKIKEIETMLDPNALTIGFARRFATYKRSNLIFRNIARIQRILNNPHLPVQIIFAGKAHPADNPAHGIIKNINDIAKSEGFIGKVIIVENYNMTLARNLVQGVDIWLNNPRRPLEASGTSGQKVAINGAINFSILDGWWCEGYNGHNGWTISDNTQYNDEYHQDDADSESIYNVLEKEIIPIFYERNANNVPTKWISVMKESIKSIIRKYSMHRMVEDYCEKMYVPSMERIDKILKSNYNYITNITQWKTFIEKHWSQVYIIQDETGTQKTYTSTAGDSLDIETIIQLGQIEPSNVKVELCYGQIGAHNKIDHPLISEMVLSETSGGQETYKFKTKIQLLEGGDYGFTIRVLPYHSELIDKFEMGLVKWIM